MNTQLDAVKKEYEAITEQLSSPEILKDAKKMAELGKRQSELQGLMTLIEKLEKIDYDMKNNATMINGDEDPEMKEMAIEENIELAQRKDEIEKELEIMLLPKDPNDNKNIIVEIRGGAGGDESSLFAATLFRMYSKFAEKNNWQI
ncbi:MAG: Peptide chain release factor 1, partial [Candidatus Moranbacteria bacterium GW2011_GWD2_38_7]